MTEKRIYVIVPRNLDIPGDPPQKVTVTCGAQGGYTGHATAFLQRELFREIMTGPGGEDGLFQRTYPKGATLETIFKDVLDVSFQFILTLMVAGSRELDDAMFWLSQNNIRYWKYMDEDKKFPGQQVLAAIITAPLDDEQSKLLKAYKPWRCACNSVHNHSTEKVHGK